jgi:hypothetical protein
VAAGRFIYCVRDRGDRRFGGGRDDVRLLSQCRSPSAAQIRNARALGPQGGATHQFSPPSRFVTVVIAG